MNELNIDNVNILLNLLNNSVKKKMYISYYIDNNLINPEIVINKLKYNNKQYLLCVYFELPNKNYFSIIDMTGHTHVDINKTKILENNVIIYSAAIRTIEHFSNNDNNELFNKINKLHKKILTNKISKDVEVSINIVYHRFIYF